MRPACLHVRAHIYCLEICIRKDTDCLYEIVFGDNIQRDEAQRNRAGEGRLSDKGSVVGKMSGVSALGLIVSILRQRPSQGQKERAIERRK